MNRPYTLRHINKLNINQDWYKKLKKLRAVLDLDIVGGPWLAGGLIRRVATGTPLDGTDVDIFLPESYDVDDKQQKQVVNITGIEKVQVVRNNRFSTPYQLLNKFGLTVCQFATDGEYVVHNVDSFKDHDSKTLRYSIESGKAVEFTQQLVDKYVAYGFKPTDDLNKLYPTLPEKVASYYDDKEKAKKKKKLVKDKPLKAAFELDLLS